MINLYYAVIQATKQGAGNALKNYLKHDRTFHLFKDMIHRFVYLDTPTNQSLDQVGFEAFSEMEIEHDSTKDEWLEYIQMVEGMSGNSLNESDITVVYLDDRLSYFILLDISKGKQGTELEWYEFVPSNKWQGKLRKVV